MLDKKFDLGGLQTRPHNLVQDPSKSKYNLNLQKDHSGTIRKRWSFSKVAGFGTSAETIGRLKTYQKQAVFGGEIELLVFYGGFDTLIKRTLDAVTFEVVTDHGTVSDGATLLDVKSYNNVAYWIERNGLMKYDGLAHYRSGLPMITSATFTGAAGAGNKTYRTFLYYPDHQSQVALSDYYEFTENRANGAKIQAIRTTDFKYTDGYDFKYMRVTGASSYSGSGDFTATTTVNNLVVGNYLTFEIGTTLYRLKVKTVNAGTVVFDINGFKMVGGIWGPNASVPAFSLASGDLKSNIFVLVYNMDALTNVAEFAGYGTYDPTGVIPATISNFSLGGAITPAWMVGASSYFADFYDINYAKIPFSGYDSYNYASAKGIAFYNGLLLVAKSDKVEFSNISVGSTVEDSDGLNFFLVGTSEDGPITAIFANDDYVIVHREKECYYLTGNIFTGNYRVQSLNSTFLGSKNQTSMLKLFGQNYHFNIKGAYLISQGGKTEELSDDIESLFTSIPFDGVDIKNGTPLHTIVYSINDTIITYFRDSGGNHAHLSYNYNFKDWFWWKDLDTSGGMEIFLGKLFVASDLELFEENDLLADKLDGTNLTAVPAVYESSWQYQGEPSLSKKVERLKVFTDEVDQNMVVKTKVDFNETVDTSETLAISSSDPLTENGMARQDLNRKNVFAISVRVENNEVGKDIGLLGYELDIRGNQEEIRR